MRFGTMFSLGFLATGVLVVATAQAKAPRVTQGAATTNTALATKDPLPLTLRQADMPGVGEYERDYGMDSYLVDALRGAGLHGRAANSYLASFSNEKGHLQVTGVVITTSSPAEAKTAFAVAKKAREAFRRRAGLPSVKPFSLPSFGNEQVALINGADSSGIGTAEALVRKNTVLWLVYVSLERRPPPSDAELIADLKKYAAQQKTRVGGG